MSVKLALLEGARRLGGFALARRLTRSGLRILAYHGLWVTPGRDYGDRLFMSPAQFEARMRRLKRSGYPVLTLGEAVDGLAAGRLPERATVITIDDGWRSTYTHMLPVLEELGLPATLYVTSWYVDQRLPIMAKAIDYSLQMSSATRIAWGGVDLPTGTQPECEIASLRLGATIDARPVEEREAALRELCALLGVPVEPWWSAGQFHLMTREEIGDAARRGLDIQLHTHRHCAIDRYPERLAGEIADNRAVLGKCVDPASLVHFCYPSGGFDPAAPAILKAAGVRSATLCEHGLNGPDANPYRLRRFLDGRSVSPTVFDAYLSGVLDLREAVIGGARLR